LAKVPQWYAVEPSVATMMPYKTNAGNKKIAFGNYEIRLVVNFLKKDLQWHIIILIKF
jgi:hypothetical protein